VDDEPLALEELSYQLEAFDEVTVVGEGANGLEAVELIRQLRPDLVMLDIQMPGKDGFQVVREVTGAEDGPIPYIVFITAYDQYALRAFEVNAIDYLLKPIDEQMLSRAIQRVKKRMEATVDIRSHLETLLRSLGPAPLTPRSNRISLKKGARIILVDVHDIVYAYIAEGVVFIVTDAQEGMTSYRTLEELELDLDPQVFWRVHRSYIANINRVSEVIPWFSGTYRLIMNDPQKREIPLSRTQSKKLRKTLKW
jgi:two-component system LytT family response regulator/two-component system response regulator LytT